MGALPSQDPLWQVYKGTDMTGFKNNLLIAFPSGVCGWVCVVLILNIYWLSICWLLIYHYLLDTWTIINHWRLMIKSNMIQTDQPLSWNRQQSLEDWQDHMIQHLLLKHLQVYIYMTGRTPTVSQMKVDLTSQPPNASQEEVAMTGQPASVSQ